MSANRPELTQAEWTIMRVIWQHREVIVRDVYQALAEHKGWAQTTVRTMMERLAKKGYLKQKKIGPVYLYQPAVAKKQVVRQAMRNLLARATGEGLLDLVACAVEEGAISDQELEQLEQLIQKQKEKKS